MFTKLHTLFAGRSQASRRSVRLQLEDLEGRTVLSTFATISLPLIAEVKADLAEVKADAHGLSYYLPAHLSTTVQSDLKSLNADLNVVSADVAAGKNAVADIGTAIAAEGKLAKDLWGDASDAVKDHLNDLRCDMKDLKRDAIRLQQDVNADLREDQGEVTMDIGVVSKALAGNTKADIVEDVAELNSDLKTLTADMAAGKIVIGDLNAIAKQTQDLIKDLGPNVSSRLKRDLNTLAGDVKDVTGDYTAIQKDANGDVSKAKADVVKLTNELGKNASPAAAADLKALDAILAEVAADIKAGGGDAVRDLTAANTAASQLITDAGGSITLGAQETFYDLTFNLTDVSIDLATLKV